MADKTMQIVFVVDVSGSMLPDGKIQSLNTAIEEAVPHLRRSFLDAPGVDAHLRALAFSSRPRWVVEHAVPIADFTWKAIDADEEGLTETGAAVSTVTDVLEREATGGAVPPGIVLVSDGMPTDTTAPAYVESIERLRTTPVTASSTRLAVGIGRDADMGALELFCSKGAPGPTRADDPQQLMVAIRSAASSLVRSATELPTWGPDGPLPGAR